MLNENKMFYRLLALAHGPNTSITCYKGYFVNGFKFHTEEREKRRKIQNSEVVVIVKTSSF